MDTPRVNCSNGTSSSYNGVSGSNIGERMGTLGTTCLSLKELNRSLRSTSIELLQRIYHPKNRAGKH